MECTYKLFWAHPFGQILFERKEGQPDDSGWVTASMRLEGTVFHVDMQVSLDDVTVESVLPALELIAGLRAAEIVPDVVVKGSTDTVDEAMLISAAIMAAGEMDFDIFDEDEQDGE